MRAICLSIAVLLAGACAEPPRLIYPEIDFGGRPALSLAVSDVEVTDLYRPPLARPHVEHLAPVAPAAAFRRWAGLRLHAAGGGARLRVAIEDARIVETPLETDDSLLGLLTAEPAARLEGRGAVSVALTGPGGEVLATARAEAFEVREVPEDATLNERDELMYQIVEALAGRLDGILETEIRRYFGRWLL